MASQYVRVSSYLGNCGSFCNLLNRAIYQQIHGFEPITSVVLRRHTKVFQMQNYHALTSLNTSTENYFKQQQLQLYTAYMNKRYFADSDKTVVSGQGGKQKLARDIVGAELQQGESQKPMTAHHDSSFEPHQFHTTTTTTNKAEDICSPSSGQTLSPPDESSPSAEPTQRSSGASSSTTTAGTTAIPTSGFCAGVAPPEPKKAPTQSSGSGGGASNLNAPDIKLPDRKQVEKTFFRILAYIYDASVMILNWIRRATCRYIIMNPTVRMHWQNLRNKMEDAKKP